MRVPISFARMCVGLGKQVLERSRPFLTWLLTRSTTAREDTRRLVSVNSQKAEEGRIDLGVFLLARFLFGITGSGWKHGCFVCGICAHLVIAAGFVADHVHVSQPINELMKHGDEHTNGITRVCLRTTQH